MNPGDGDGERAEEGFWQWFALIVLLACWAAEGALVPGEESGENGESTKTFLSPWKGEVN